LEPRQRFVSGVGANVVPDQAAPTRIVELMHPHRIAKERFRRRHVLQSYLRPQPAGVPERIQSRLFGDARPREDHDLVTAPESRIFAKVSRSGAILMSSRIPR